MRDDSGLIFWAIVFVCLVFALGVSVGVLYSEGKDAITEQPAVEKFSSPRPAVIQTGGGDLVFVVIRPLSYGYDSAGDKKFFSRVYSYVRMDGTEGIVKKGDIVEIGEEISKKLTKEEMKK